MKNHLFSTKSPHFPHFSNKDKMDLQKKTNFAALTNDAPNN